MSFASPDGFKRGLRLPLVDSVGMEEQERERRRQVVEKFQKAPFEEIAAHCGARVLHYPLDVYIVRTTISAP